MEFAAGVLGDNAVHEVKKLDAATTLVLAPADLAGGDIESGKQRGCAMPLVIMGLSGPWAAARPR